MKQILEIKDLTKKELTAYLKAHPKKKFVAMSTESCPLAQFWKSKYKVRNIQVGRYRVKVRKGRVLYDRSLTLFESRIVRHVDTQLSRDPIKSETMLEVLTQIRVN